MFFIFRVFAFLLFVISSFAQPTFAQSPLTTHLESIRQGSHAAVPQVILADTASASALLPTLATYQDDTLAAVRSRAYNIAKRIGQRSSNPAVRQTTTAQLTRGIADPDAGISGNNSDALTGFRQTDFSAAAQTQLVNYLQPGTPHLDQVAMLAGFVSEESARAALQSLLTPKVSATTRWAIRLALARTGDEVAINYVLDKLNAAPVNDALVYDIVPGLVYTRQPAIFRYLETLVMSDEPNCQSADPDSQQRIRCGYRVMEALAPALTDFPVAVDAYGELLTDDYEQSLREVRAWLRGREDYPMRINSY